MSEKSKSGFYRLLTNNWFIVGIIIILIGFDIAIHIPFVDIQSNYFGAMLGFIGVLATFVVIGNYAQVKEIEEKTKNSLIKTKEEYDNKINELNKIVESLNDKDKELRIFVNIATTLNMATFYRDSGKYYEALDWYFKALKYSFSFSKDEQLVHLTLINYFKNNYGKEVSGLNNYYIDEYISILHKVTHDPLNLVKEIIDFLNSLKKDNEKEQ